MLEYFSRMCTLVPKADFAPRDTMLPVSFFPFSDRKKLKNFPCLLLIHGDKWNAFKNREMSKLGTLIGSKSCSAEVRTMAKSLRDSQP